LASVEKIKILHFFGRGKIGGQEKALYQLLKASVNDKDIELGVAIWKQEGLYSKKIKALNIPIVDLHLKSGFSFKIDKKLSYKLKKYHIHHFHDPSPNIIFLSLISGSKIKRVFTRRGGLHDYHNKGLKIILKYFINKILIRNFIHGYSGNTRLAADFVKQFYGIKNKSIYILYNGMFYESLKPVTPQKNILQNLNLSESEFKIGTACHLLRWKRVDLIIRSFSHCDIKKKKLVIFGKGYEEYKLKKVVKDLKLNEQVIFVGEVPSMADYFQILDCFILASGREESFGNALVEAMYSKIPSIIMSDSVGLKEHIIDNQTGFVAKDELDLANKIEYIYNNPEISKIIARDASSYVFDKYSISNMVKAYKKFYFDVLGKPE